MVDHPPEQVHRELVRWTRALAIFTGLLFAAGIATNFFIWQQWEVVSKAQVDTREQLRAFVNQSGGQQVLVHTSDGKLQAIIFVTHFQNVGGTRTGRFQGWISVHYFDEDVANSLDLTKPWDKVDLADTVIGPNSSHDMAVRLTGEDGDKIVAKRGVGLLWGHFEFTDIFEPKKVHSTSFCALLTPGPVVGPDVSLKTTPYRNDCNKSD